MAHILLIDDDNELTDLLKELLQLENFTVSVAHDGKAGLAMLDSHIGNARQPYQMQDSQMQDSQMQDSQMQDSHISQMQDSHIDMILLDVMMPKLNGIDTLRRLRESSDIPVLMLTAKGEEIDRVVGLELGADDYLAKPFSERELLARIRAILRRAQSRQTDNAPEVIEYFDVKLYPGKLEAYCNDHSLDLTSTEFALLQHFVQHPGKVLTKETLSLDVLGKHLAPFDRAVDMQVSNLRKKLPDWANGKARIKTLRGRGYLLTEGGD